MRSSKSMLCWGQRPRLRRTLSMLVVMLWPLMTADPELGENIPVSTDIVVVLPAPLWPSSAVISPSYAEKVTPFTACTVSPPNVCRGNGVEVVQSAGYG